jgi:HD-like signal output (HDOD) protein
LDDNIFSAAILHDMGKIVLSQYDYPNYVLALSEQTPYDIKKNLAAEKKYCAISHPEAGELIAKHWNLPEIICQSVKFHHSPSMADDEYKRAVSLIYLANLLSNMIENDNNFDANIINEEDIEVLGLTLGDLSPLFTELLDLDFEPEELENMF